MQPFRKSLTKTEKVIDELKKIEWDIANSSTFEELVRDTIKIYDKLDTVSPKEKCTFSQEENRLPPTVSPRSGKEPSVSHKKRGTSIQEMDVVIEKIEKFYWELYSIIQAHSDYSKWNSNKVDMFMDDIARIFRERERELKSLIEELKQSGGEC